MSITINFVRVGTYNDKFPSILFDQVVLQGHVKHISCCITTTTRPMATKLGKLLTYYKIL